VQPDDDFDLTFDVLNSARQSIVPGGEVDLSFGTESVTNLTIPTSGTYVIAVKGFDGTSGGYILTLNRAEPSAGSIVQASDTLNDSSEHLFPFNSTSGGVTVVAVVNPDDDLDVILGIYNDDTDTLLEEIDETFSRETLTFVVPSAGNYYFKVTGFESATGNYEISMTGPPEVAFVLANRDEVQGSFGPTSVLEYYYSGELGDIFTVSVLTADDIDLVIEIYEDGDTLTALAEVDDNLSGGEEELTFTLPAEGLYIIRIREFFGEPGTFIMNIR
jgi:hypothetical protein